MPAAFKRNYSGQNLRCAGRRQPKVGILLVEELTRVRIHEDGGAGGQIFIGGKGSRNAGERQYNNNGDSLEKLSFEAQLSLPPRFLDAVHLGAESKLKPVYITYKNPCKVIFYR